LVGAAGAAVGKAAEKLWPGGVVVDGTVIDCNQSAEDNGKAEVGGAPEEVRVAGEGGVAKKEVDAIVEVGAVVGNAPVLLGNEGLGGKPVLGNRDGEPPGGEGDEAGGSEP
jgi:hypothetical protein